VTVADDWKDARESQPGHILFTSSSDRGQSWPPDARGLDRAQLGGSRSSSPRVDSDGQGHVYAVWWTKHRDGTKDVLASTSRDFGVSFGLPVKVNADAGAFPPELSEECRLKGTAGDVEGPMQLAADAQGHLAIAFKRRCCVKPDIPSATCPWNPR
jgi:hypothetical protein